MAWSEVKPQSVRNCFAHVPILNDDQKKELSSGDEIDPDVQIAIMDAREDIADRACLMDGSPRMPLEERFSGACGQGNSSLTPVTYTDTQRDYYTRLSALLDGSTSLNNVIQRMSTNKEFMECFNVEPRAVPFDDLSPDEDDPNDEDYGNDFASMRQPGTAITSSQAPPLLDTPRPQSTMLFSTFGASDVLVLTEGATLLAPGTIVAPPGSILSQRSLQTRHQSYTWPIDDIRSSDISDQDFLQYDEDGAWSEEKSEDERIDILTKAAEILQGDENKSLRHAIDLAAEKLTNPGIGVPNASLVKDHNTRERKKMKDIRAEEATQEELSWRSIPNTQVDQRT
ncbi:hypothetical protein EDD11_007958 [Mortierella claussenii]|nr:hypothetical protein EDD11_007958 [Mortierella claussenii]